MSPKKVTFWKSLFSGHSAYHYHNQDMIMGRWTRANCSRKLRKIESGSLERWLGWQGWWMIICKWTVPLDDYLQEARSSGWSFASGLSLRMIIYKWPDPLDDHLHEARSSGWSFASGRILRMINCKRPDSSHDLLQEAGSSRWSFVRGQILRMIICKWPDPLDDHLQ